MPVTSVVTRPQRIFASQLLTPAGWQASQVITVTNGIITSIVDGNAADADINVSVLIPGMPNLHSHAFQRGMAGLAEKRGPSADSFWTWRQVMYRFLERLTPEDLQAIAAMAYVEMLENGFTRVGEFHYLHHDAEGNAYANPSAMSDAIIAAASQTGINITHLPVFYAHSGFGGQPPEYAQRRFIHSLDSFAALYQDMDSKLASVPGAVLGVAPHSLRASTQQQLQALAGLGNGPIHIHIAEQMKEVQASLAHSGARPVQWLLDHADVNSRWCLVHATHLDNDECSGLARSGAVAGLCPITEANLGDGLFPLPDYLDTGGAIGIGSDSNVFINALEELRTLEYGQRLNLQSRNIAARRPEQGCGHALWQRSVAGGAQALGVKGGICVGACADMISLKTRRLPAHLSQSDNILEQLVFCQHPGIIDNVWVNGTLVVRQGSHPQRDIIQNTYVNTINRVLQ